MFVLGTRYFGPVDRIPGEFVVVTQFFHFNGIPLIPIAGAVVRDDESLVRGFVGISDVGPVVNHFSWKSCAWAWARSFGFFFGILSAMGLVPIWVTSALDLAPGSLGAKFVMFGGLGFGLGLLGFLFMTRRGLSASGVRSHELRRLAASDSLPRANTQ